MGKAQPIRLQESLAWLIVGLTLLKLLSSHLLPLCRSLQSMDWSDLEALKRPGAAPAAEPTPVVVDIPSDAVTDDPDAKANAVELVAKHTEAA